MIVNLISNDIEIMKLVFRKYEQLENFENLFIQLFQKQ